MAGIYIHIPFCKRRCNYCDFTSTTNETRVDPYIAALCHEIISRKNELSGQTIQTIYFGGGTPSQLNHKQLKMVIDTIYSNYPIEQEAEITIECNPDDLTEKYIAEITKLPFNRISIGIQSFDDNDLKLLNRRHNAASALKAIELCTKYQIDNISIDLMYGLPNQTLAGWKKNIEIACSLPIKHISAYHLIFEKGTPLHKDLKIRKISEIDEETSISMFKMLIETLKSKNILQYEISNFAKEGYVSKHNSSYWLGVPYLGFGISAHSFDGTNRYWNKPSIISYLEQSKSGVFAPEIEISTPQSRYNDYIITALRTSWGIDLEELSTKFGAYYYNYFIKEAQPFIKNGLLEINGNKITISASGIFISDSILSELLHVG